MRKRAGFTLVETSVAVAVIGLLSAIAIPSFRAVRSNGLATAKKNNVRTINHAVELWAMDNFCADGTLIDASITNYFKGNQLAQFSVGSSHVNLTNITNKAVGHTFTVQDVY